MQYDIQIGDYRLGMLDKVEIHKSVEQLADTAVITLPASQYNQALQVEDKLKRGDGVIIKFGYEETGMELEFDGWLQRISTDGGNIKLHCEDDLFLFRKELPNEVLKNVTLEALLKKVINGCGIALALDCTYSWTYQKFVINNATGFDVLKKVQEECGADIYVDDKLHVHPPGEKIGDERFYDLALNVCATSDEASMKARGELEVKRRTFDGYEGSITGWLIPMCKPADSVTIKDKDYPYKDGTYFVTSVTTEFGKEGGKRKIDLGFRLS